MSIADNPLSLPVGRITHSRSDILRVLDILEARKVPVTSAFADASPLFESHILHVDTTGAFIVMAPSGNEGANSRLMAQARCVFYAEPQGWHIEFISANPEVISHEGRRAIRLSFPTVLVNLFRRESRRASIPTSRRFQCIADDGGVLSFHANITDMSAGGVGLLVYSSAITLEPGTILKGCRIEIDGEPPITVDLEVRYSESTFVQMPDGTQAKRSGCRFVQPPPQIRAILEKLGASLA